MKILRISIEVIVIAALVFGAIFVFRACKKAKDEKKGVTTAVQIDRYDSTRHYRDLYDREHASKLIVEADMQTLQLLYGQKIDSVAKALGIKVKQLQQLTTASTTTGQTLSARLDTVYLDTNRRPQISFQYADDWLQLQGDITDDVQITYEIRDSLIIATHTRRRNIFSPRLTYADIYSLNPHTRVNHISSLRIAPGRARRIGIGPYVGCGYTGAQLVGSVGLSLHYSLIQF